MVMDAAVALGSGRGGPGIFGPVPRPPSSLGPPSPRPGGGVWTGYTESILSDGSPPPAVSNIPVPHSRACEMAREADCTCACGGRLHGSRLSRSSGRFVDGSLWGPNRPWDILVLSLTSWTSWGVQLHFVDYSRPWGSGLYSLLWHPSWLSYSHCDPPVANGSWAVVHLIAPSAGGAPGVHNLWPTWFEFRALVWWGPYMVANVNLPFRALDDSLSGPIYT